MSTFEEYVKRGAVKKQIPAEPRAQALIKSAEKSKRFVEKLADIDENAEHIITEWYDIVRQYIEAQLAREGYKSYSHEATIQFAQEKYSLLLEEKAFLDNVRKTRNDIKYYGKEATKAEAEQTATMLKSLLIKIKGENK